MLAPLVFDSALLTELVSAVQRRSKAISYRTALDMSRERDGDLERLNIDIANGVRLRCSIWDNGAFWIGITKPGPRRNGAWAINEQFDGCWNEILPQEFVARLEHTHAFPNIKDVLQTWHDQHLTLKFRSGEARNETDS